MSAIEIQSKKETADGWEMVVEVAEESVLDYTVTVDRDYWQELTDGSIEPEDLVKKSFEFLLQREPKESILSSFNLKIISRYFSEYEMEMKKLFQ